MPMSTAPIQIHMTFDTSAVDRAIRLMREGIATQRAIQDAAHHFSASAALVRSAVVARLAELDADKGDA